MTSDSNGPLYFQCNICGECCSSWNIPIETEKARQLLEKSWVKERLDETRRELRQTEGGYRLPLTDENVCVFLAGDKRCMIETREGLHLKPHECQRFPFASVQMPDGSVQHDTSASCKRVAEKLLLAFQPVLPKPQSVEDASAPAREELETFPAQVPVGLFWKIALSEYQNWLAQLEPVFRDEASSPEAAIRQAKALLEGRRFHDNYGHGGFGRNGCLVLFLFLRKPYGTLSWLSLLRGKSYDDPRLFGLPVDPGAARKIPRNPDCDVLLKAFLYNLLHRKVIVARGQSLHSLLAMAGVACVLVNWYARVLAWIRHGEEESTLLHVDAADVSMAIRLVERYYTGHQPRFLRFFHSRWRGWLIGKLLLG